MIDILSKAFQTFSDGLRLMQWYWMLWIYLMVLVNGVLPIFFLPQFTSIIVLVSSFVGLAIGLVLTHALGHTKILGLMHFPWFPMICFQIYYFKQQNYMLGSIHDYWLFSSLVISILSVILDVKDVYQYLVCSAPSSSSQDS